MKVPKEEIAALRAQVEQLKETDRASFRAWEKSEVKVKRLRTALEELVAYQNGSPLPSYDEEWANAMRLADEALRGEGEADA